MISIAGRSMTWWGLLATAFGAAVIVPSLIAMALALWALVGKLL
jgi:hypothetical protein